MYKQHLQNAIIKEIEICKRLYTKIPAHKMDFRPAPETRSVIELLQYLSFAGTAMLYFWLKEEDLNFSAFWGRLNTTAQQMKNEQFLPIMDDQIETVKNLFDQINEEELFQKDVTYPWGAKARLGEAIITTSVKWLAAYKLQLFLYLKQCTDQKLGTADAWVLTDLAM